MNRYCCRFVSLEKSEMTDWFPCLAVQGQTRKHGTSDKAHRQVTVERLRFCLPVFSLLLSRILVLVTIMLSWVVHFFVAAAVVVVGHTNILTQHRKPTQTHTYIYILTQNHPFCFSQKQSTWLLFISTTTTTMMMMTRLAGVSFLSMLFLLFPSSCMGTSVVLPPYQK